MGKFLLRQSMSSYIRGKSPFFFKTCNVFDSLVEGHVSKILCRIFNLAYDNEILDVFINDCHFLIIRENF